jgi:hypothetical protein
MDLSILGNGNKSLNIITVNNENIEKEHITTYSLYYNGEFITNDILNERKFIKILEENQDHSKGEV